MARIHAAWRAAGPWLGVATAPASLMLGGGVAQRVSPDLVPLALGLGAGALVVLSTLQGRLGAARGEALVALARPVLGERAARWSNTLLVAGLMVGWSAFGVGVAGGSLARLLSIPEPAAFVLWTAVLLAGLWRGIRRGSLIALAGSAATLALMGWGLTLAGGGGAGPAAPAVPAGGLAGGIGLVVGYGAAFSLRCPDFTRHLPPRQVGWIALFGFGLPLLAVAAAGAWLARTAGTWDLGRLLTELGFPVAAHAFVAVGFLGAGVSNLHSGSLALQDLARCTRPRALLAMGAAAVGLAWLDFEQAMLVWLQLLGALVLPLLAVVLTHHALRGANARGANAPALLAWAGGAALGGTLQGAWPAALVGAAAAAGGYGAWLIIKRQRSTHT